MNRNWQRVAAVSRTTRKGSRDERTRFQRQAGAGGRRLQRHRQRHRAGVPRQGRARRGLRHPRPARPIIRRTKDRISTASIMSQLDVSDPQAIETFQPSFEKLDVLVLAQGAVIYRRGEFEMDGFRKVLEVNLMSLMACATKFHAMLAASQRLADHRQFDRGLSFDHGQSRLQRLEDRRGRVDAHAGRGLGRERHPRQRHRARPGRHQDDQGDDGQSEAARRRARSGSR